MSGAQSRLSKLTNQLVHTPSPPPRPEYRHDYNHHSLSPTSFLNRAAAIEPDVYSSLINTQPLGLPIIRLKQYITSL